MNTMDALVCTKPGELTIVRRPQITRGDGEVLVRPVRIGICGTDYHIYEGNQPFLNYPRVMGHELAVEVLEAQPGTGFAPGQLCVEAAPPGWSRRGVSPRDGARVEEVRLLVVDLADERVPVDLDPHEAGRRLLEEAGVVALEV